MIKVSLTDGRVIEFIDGKSPEEIAQAVANFTGAECELRSSAIREIRAEMPELVAPESSTQIGLEKSRLEPGDIVPAAVRFRLTPYSPDPTDGNDADAMRRFATAEIIRRLPEEGRAESRDVARVVLEKSAQWKRGSDPPIGDAGDPFRDNWFPNWHRPR